MDNNTALIGFPKSIITLYYNSLKKKFYERLTLMKDNIALIGFSECDEVFSCRRF